MTEKAEELIARLEDRKAKLKRIQVLQAEVSALEQEVNRSNDMSPEVAAITQIVCEHFHTNLALMRAKIRREKEVIPRHIIWYLCRKIAETKFARLGEVFCKNHASIVNGCARIGHAVSVDHRMRDTVNILENRSRKAIRELQTEACNSPHQARPL